MQGTVPTPLRSGCGVARPAKTSVAAMQMDSGEAGRKMFDKRLLRRGYRAQFEDHLDCWRGRSAQQYVGPPGRLDDPTAHVRVCVRKRPIFQHEVQEEEYDVVTVRGDEAVIHNCLTKPDLKTLYVHHSGFRFSDVFGEVASDDDVYVGSVSPLVQHALLGGIATVFMFGQTGSGKTHTMDGILKRAAAEIYGDSPPAPLGRDVSLSAFEIAGKSMRDLIDVSGRAAPRIMQDERRSTHVVGLAAREARSPEELLAFVKSAKANRATRATQVHEGSSRSHAVIRVTIVDGMTGAAATLTLVDCAGTERREDTSHHDEQSRKAAAEINSSLFALKECFRAMRSPGQQPPFRESFLTRVLADSFAGDDGCRSARVLAIGTVSPSASDTEHSIATLRALQQLQGTQLSFEAKEDVQRAMPAARDPHPKMWSEEEARQWLSTAIGGRAKMYLPALSKGTDGKHLVRWPAVRFTQLCGGDAAIGDRLYQDLKRRFN